MYFPTTRVLTILELLQSRQQLSGPELAERLEVNTRTVRRYITMLQDLGIPVEAERGRHGSYRLRPGFKLPPLMFTEDEALALTLGLLAARGLGLTAAAPAVEGALAKIERVVDIYGIVYRPGFWYAVGYCHLRTDLRVFRLDRILQAELQDETFIRPPDFDSLDYVKRSLANVPDIWAVEVLLETTLEEARRYVSPVIATLDQAPDGVMLRCSAGSLEWIARFLTGLEYSFIVLKPPELRVELQKQAARLAEMAARTR